MSRGVAIGVAVFAALGALASGCESASRARLCEPGDPDACGADEACTVDEDGVPVCLPPGTLADGEACEGAGDCAAGSGCVRFLGVARCVRFCRADATADWMRCDAAEGCDGSGLCGRCSAALPDRPDLRVCVYPCREGRDDPRSQCPEGSTCEVDEALERPVCQG
ncbi:MAG: hypothetical protein ACYTF3_00620 [Planctomycetota bacterium]